MFHTYAVEPRALTRWEDARWLLSELHPSKGRFILDLPRKKWKRQVYEALPAGLSVINKLRMTELIKKVDKRSMVPSKYEYDKSLCWRNNAMREFFNGTVKAVIVDEADSATENSQLCVRSMSADSPLWKCGTGAFIPRSANDYANSIGHILADASQIIFIDPYLRFSRASTMRVVEELLICARPTYQRDAPSRVCFVTNDKYDLRDRDRGLRIFSDAIRNSFDFLLYRISEASSARFHNRYILTNRWGVQLGDSIDEGARKDEDRISILDEHSYHKLWKEYTDIESHFVLADDAPISLAQSK